MKKYGIEETKQAVKDVFEIGKNFKEKFEDDQKIDYLEMLQLTPELPKLVSIATHLKVVGLELSDLDSEEINELAKIVGVKATELIPRFGMYAIAVISTTDFILSSKDKFLIVLNDWKAAVKK